MDYGTVSVLSITFGIIQGECAMCPAVHVSSVCVDAALSCGYQWQDIDQLPYHHCCGVRMKHDRCNAHSL